jgi:hypothetical protein
MRVDSPTDDSPGSNAKHLRIESRAQRRATGRENFGFTSYFDSTYGPRVQGRHIVDYERDPGILGDVSILLSLRKPAVTANLNRVLVGIITKTYWYE